MKSESKLFIIDIDGTLLKTTNLALSAIEKTALQLWNIDQAMTAIDPSGLTDRMIFQTLVDKHTIQHDDLVSLFDMYCSLYIQNLGEAIQSSTESLLCDGVIDFLENATQDSNMYLSLGTGNIEQAAFIKLQKYDIAKYFPVGGFGYFDLRREYIIQHAFRKAQLHYKIPFTKINAWVIGDTPKDISAGKGFGLKTMGIATGNYNFNELANCKPNAVLPDLKNWDDFTKCLEGRLPLSFQKPVIVEEDYAKRITNDYFIPKDYY